MALGAALLGSIALGAASSVTTAGNLAATEVQDALFVSAAVLVSGDLDTAEQSDSASLNARVLINGSLAVTEEPDTLFSEAPIYYHKKHYFQLGVMKSSKRSLGVGIA